MFASLSQLLGFDAPTAPRKALAPVAANQSNQPRKPKPHAKPPGKIWAIDATPSRVPRRAKPCTPAPCTPAPIIAETPFQTPFSPDAPPASAIHDATLQAQLVRKPRLEPSP